MQTLQKRLENIFELLNCWQQYIDVIYMSEIGASLMDVVAKDESLTSARQSYSKREKEHDVS
jgi:hypothetical protein